MDTCQRSQRLREHHVSVVNDYTDTQEIIQLWKKLKTNEQSNKTFN